MTSLSIANNFRDFACPAPRATLANAGCAPRSVGAGATLRPVSENFIAGNSAAVLEISPAARQQSTFLQASPPTPNFRRLATMEQRDWAFGLNAASALGNYHSKWVQWQRENSAIPVYIRQNGLLMLPPLVTRTESLVIIAQQQLTERTLNEQIENALKASGITLGKGERLDFSIDQDGNISVTGLQGANAEKAHVLENVMNADNSLRSNLFLHHVQGNAIKSGGWSKLVDQIDARMVSDAHDWANGIEPAYSDLKYEFTHAFSFQDGRIFQGDTPPEDRVFSDRLDSFEGLSKIMGLDESASKNIQAFVSALEGSVQAAQVALNRQLQAAFDRAGLGDVTKKITFSQDADGRIVIEGNIREGQKERLARIINGNTELSESIKTLGAKRAVLDELKGAITDEPELNTRGGWERFLDRGAGFDLSKDSLALAREQLLKNFLDSKGISKSDLANNKEGVFARHTELDEIKGLRNEIANLLSPQTKSSESVFAESLATKAHAQSGAAPVASAPKLHALLAIRRGEFVDVVSAVERFDIDQEVITLKANIAKSIAGYNDKWSETGQTNMHILDHTLTFDENGRASIEVVTADGEFNSTKHAKKFMMSIANALKDHLAGIGSIILDTHDDEHGDVQEYKHSVVIQSGFVSANYEVISPEADRAALQEMTELMSDIGSALGDLFRGMSIDNPFNLFFGKDGLLSLEGNSLSAIESQNVRQMMEQINRFLTTEYEGGDTDGILPNNLTGIAEKLLALKEAKGKIHDKSLVPERILFAF